MLLYRMLLNSEVERALSADLSLCGTSRLCVQLQTCFDKSAPQALTARHP